MIRKLLCFFGWHEKIGCTNEHWLDSMRYFRQIETPWQFITTEPSKWNECKHCKRRL